MNNIKVDFSIKDLENLSGVKAHTIRIWEKRYNLLHPERTETNIRHYSIKSLQKLLNVTYLNQNGFKISKIARLTEDEIPVNVREIASRGKVKHHAINAFKLAMLNFDQVLFYNTYNNLLDSKTFREIFYEIFIPLLEDIGLLWQTDTISPAHEHFLSIHIKQKILLNIEKLQSLEPQPISKTYVLFLPDNEIHDIGLLFINYELRSRGYHTIFLGESVPMHSLVDLYNFYEDMDFVTYFTIKPDDDKIVDYVQKFKTDVLKNKSCLHILGKQLRKADTTKFPKGISALNAIEDFVKVL